MSDENRDPIIVDVRVRVTLNGNRDLAAATALAKQELRKQLVGHTAVSEAALVLRRAGITVVDIQPIASGRINPHE